MSGLHPTHLEDLRKSGLSDETIREAEIATVIPCDINKALGWNVPGLTSCYRIPYPGTDFSRYRCFYEDGAGPKYLQKKATGNRLYVPHSVKSVLQDTAVDLYLTEGEKKALRAAQDGLTCIGLSGLWNWSNGNKELIPDFDQIGFEGRRVYIVPDNDWLNPNRHGYKKNLRQAISGLGERLQERGATVEIIILPEGKKKIGLDDYLLGNSIDKIKELPLMKLSELKAEKSQKFDPREYTEQILDMYKKRILYVGLYNRGYLYGYEPCRNVYKDSEGTIRNLLRTKFQLNSSYQIGEVIRDISECVYVSELPRQPHWRLINLEDKIFDVLTGAYVETDDHFFLQHVPQKLDENQNACPQIDKLFQDWVGPDRKIILYELLAFCLIRNYFYTKFFFIYGSGSNGKSAFLRLLKRFLGGHNVSSIAANQLVSNRFATVKLHGKLANVCGEIGLNVIKHSDLLKSLTGEDEIYCEEKFKAGFSFVNTAKIIFNANAIPVTTDKTHAFYRRFYPVHFDHTFDHGDPKILDSLPHAEYQGLLHVLLYEILPMLIARDFRFSIDLDVTELEQQYEDLSNPLERFIAEFFEEDVDGIVPKQALVELFSRYCRTQGLKQVSDSEVGKYLKDFKLTQVRLSELDIAFWRDKMEVDISLRPRVWTGLAFRGRHDVTSFKAFSNRIRRREKKEEAKEEVSFTYRNQNAGDSGDSGDNEEKKKSLFLSVDDEPSQEVLPWR